MSGLSQFEFDVFLSYGWAGIASARDGDRGWVAEFKEKLTDELSAEMGRGARIFLDVEQARNGELSANLYDAIASAALFLSVITPGSCRRESWCHRELAAFQQKTPAVLPNSRQIFTIRLRDVPQQEWPVPLQPIVPYDFLTENSPPLPFAREDLSDTRTGAGKLVQKLAFHIRRTLSEIEHQIAHTVFLAGSSMDERVRRLATEVTARGGRAICSEPPGSGETEDQFTERVRRDLLRSSISVHLIGTSASPVPAGWSETPEILQLRAANTRFGEERSRIIAWHESAATPGVPGEAAGFAQMLQGTGFEYLDSVLCQSFRKTTAAAAAEAVLTEERVAESRIVRNAAAAGTGSASSVQSTPRYVYIECVQEDLNKLEPVRAALSARNIRVKVPLFQGDESRRRKMDQAFLRVCHGVAVYFGTRNDLEAFDACQNLWDALDSINLDVPRAVLLDPYEDPIRHNFIYPGFENYRSSDVDSFAEQIGGGS